MWTLRVATSINDKWIDIYKKKYAEVKELGERSRFICYLGYILLVSLLGVIFGYKHDKSLSNKATLFDKKLWPHNYGHIREVAFGDGEK